VLLPFRRLISTIFYGASATGRSNESKVRRARPKVQFCRALHLGEPRMTLGQRYVGKILERKGLPYEN